MFKLILLITLSVTFTANAGSVDTLANCKLKSEFSEESFASYTVLRDGDRLFGRYRLTEGRDIEETDDIFLKKYEEDDLLKLKEAGVLQKLAKALSMEMEKIEKVSFFGMKEIEDDDEENDESLPGLVGEENPNPPAPPKPAKYLMEIYKVSGVIGYSTGYVGRPLEKDYQKCGGATRLIRF